MAGLRTLERQQFANGAEVEVRDVDYNLLSLEDQITNDLDTDVMVCACLFLFVCFAYLLHSR